MTQRAKHFAATAVALLVAICARTADAESLDRVAARLHEQFAGSFIEETRDGLPFTVQASDAGGVVDSTARFLLAGVAFDRFVDVLGRMEGWCRSLLLHLNVKTCVHHDDEGGGLTLYLGRKYYEHPLDAVRISFDFHGETAPGAIRTTLMADHGPYGTSKYVFVLSAVRVPRGVFVELELSNHVGSAGAIVDLYLNTIGRSKVGFTRVGETIFGNPQYVRGQVGAAERNVVRYMYALSVTLEMEGAPFERLAAAWFDATERHPRQLRELDREDYLEIKRREYENQLELQRAAERGDAVERQTPRRNK